MIPVSAGILPVAIFSRYKRFNSIFLHITITVKIYSKIMKFIKGSVLMV